jgi:hypothetical protein
MSATSTSPFAAPAANRPTAWRFSLGDLFRAITVCGLAAFALVQFGPLAAARDICMALAIALAICAWAGRSRRLLLAAIGVAVLGMVPTILAAGAPYSDRDAICFECGKSRHIHEVCGWQTRDEIHETEASRWAAPLVPAGHVHSWTGMSQTVRAWWFGSTMIGCGGPGEGAFMSWQLARLGHPEAAEFSYQEYQDVLTGKSTKTMDVHRREMYAAVAAAVKASQR